MGRTGLSPPQRCRVHVGGGLSLRLPAVSSSDGCIPPGLAFIWPGSELSVLSPGGDARGPGPHGVSSSPSVATSQGTPLENQSLVRKKSHPGAGAGPTSADTQPQIFIEPPITWIFLPSFLAPGSPWIFSGWPSLSSPCPARSPLSCSTLQWRGGGGGGDWVYFIEPDRPCCRGDTRAVLAAVVGWCKTCSWSIRRWYPCRI